MDKRLVVLLLVFGVLLGCVNDAKGQQGMSYHGGGGGGGWWPGGGGGGHGGHGHGGGGGGWWPGGGHGGGGWGCRCRQYCSYREQFSGYCRGGGGRWRRRWSRMRRCCPIRYG